MTSLGRIDPVTRHPDGSPIDPDAPARPELLRELHAELVRGKGRGLLTSAPLLVLAIGALAIGRAYPPLFFTLMWAGIAGVGAFANEAFEWFSLRRADPLTLLEREAREEAERKAVNSDYRTRVQGHRPVATLTLLSVIAIVTIIEFVRVAQTSLPDVLASVALVKPAVRAGEWWRLLTATYLHGNLLHLVGNLGALVMLGELLETYEGRMRLPVVYLVAAIAGCVCSALLSSQTSVGASAGILGLAGYLVVAAGRSRGGAPAPVRGRMLRLLGTVAVLGIAGIAFIDNGGHLGGILGGAAVGLALPRGDARRERLVTALGTVSTVILAAGAAFTVYRLLR
jgi:membrane associated rhomboid family serine protease